MKKIKRSVFANESLDYRVIDVCSMILQGGTRTCLHTVFTLAVIVDRVAAGGLLAEAQEHLRLCRKDGRTEQYALNTFRAFVMKKFKTKLI